MSFIDPDQPASLSLTDARDYADEAQPGDILALWEWAGEAGLDGGTDQFFAGTGPSVAAAREKVLADLRAEDKNPARGNFRFYLVRADE